MELHFVAARQAAEARRMGVTADTRERDLVKCDGCGMLTKHWHRLVLSSDGSVIVDALMCRACETYAVDAVKLTLSAVLVKR
jgi:hypothetical protein